MLDQLKTRAQALKREVFAVYIAAADPRTPWYAKALIFFIVAYALSPIDLIPDFVPILGYLDDLILIPGGIWLAIRLIPPEVMAEARTAAATREVNRSAGKIGMVIIVLIWIGAAAGTIYLLLRFLKRI
ncbi:MAG TPA: YkvA family protein [Anaerolineales bacterium]|nr:YkvA family protein [Anaerolineales bacterium]